MRFTIEIEMGGEFMSEGWQVTDAIMAQASGITDAGVIGDKGEILDENGKAVGTWEVAA